MAADGTVDRRRRTRRWREPGRRRHAQDRRLVAAGADGRLRPVPRPPLRSDPAGRLLPAPGHLRAGPRPAALAAARRSGWSRSTPTPTGPGPRPSRPRRRSCRRRSTPRPQKFVAAALEKELQKFPEPLRTKLRAAHATPADKRTPSRRALIGTHPSLNLNAGVLYQYDQAAADELKKDQERVDAKRAEKPAEDFVSLLNEVPGRCGRRRTSSTAATPAAEAGGQARRPDHRGADGRTAGDRRRRRRSADHGPAPGVRAASDQRPPPAGRPGAGQPGLAAPFRPRPGGDAGRLRRAGRCARRTPSCSTGWPTSWCAGWSLKRLHRLIMTSTAYRQSSRREPGKDAVDPDNALLGRYPVRRLDAEALRDRILLTERPARPDALRPAGAGRRGLRRGWSTRPTTRRGAASTSRCGAPSRSRSWRRSTPRYGGQLRPRDPQHDCLAVPDAHEQRVRHGPGRPRSPAGSEAGRPGRTWTSRSPARMAARLPAADQRRGAGLGAASRPSSSRRLERSGGQGRSSDSPCSPTWCSSSSAPTSSLCGLTMHPQSRRALPGQHRVRRRGCRAGAPAARGRAARRPRQKPGENLPLNLHARPPALRPAGQGHDLAVHARRAVPRRPVRSQARADASTRHGLRRRRGLQLRQPGQQEALRQPLEVREARPVRHGSLRAACRDTAGIVDDICVVRSMHTGHNGTRCRSATSTAALPAIAGRPTLGSWLAYGLGSESQELPAYVVLADPEGHPGGRHDQLVERLHAVALPGHRRPPPGAADPQPRPAAAPPRATPQQQNLAFLDRAQPPAPRAAPGRARPGSPHRQLRAGRRHADRRQGGARHLAGAGHTSASTASTTTRPASTARAA